MTGSAIIPYVSTFFEHQLIASSSSRWPKELSTKVLALEA